ncbi:Acg family FMN-binding oxidoreductase [Paenibacillus puldeungensis]|uniref:Acg family FMN-binding oxidoreductase n=1 Tax=Paenibacillus puldeungensis TaxID=696536 RepID=A0ABW3RV73_9BACL
MKNKRGKHRMTILLSSIGLLLIAACAALFVSSGVFTKPEYLEPWKKSYSQKFEDPRIQLAAHGLLAANGHNMQPWKIKLDADKEVFYLFADSERLTLEVDPMARQTMVSQGTFLEYVRIAGKQLGYRTDITLFPDGEYNEQALAESMKNKPVAKISITKVEAKNHPLYKYMFLPDTNRAAYEKTPLSSDQINDLLAINTDQEMNIKIFQDPESLQKLGDYAMKGAEIESGIHRISQESAEVFRANEYEKNKYRYGFSLEGQGTTGIMKHVMQGLITLFPSMNNEKTSADLYVKSTRTAVDNTPAYAMIITKDNSRMEQVKSGMLYSRLILTAHSLGLVMQPPSQVIEEYGEMKEQYTQIHKEYAPKGGTIQMFVRIGKPKQQFPQTMRRDITDLILR